LEENYSTGLNLGGGQLPVSRCDDTVDARSIVSYSVCKLRVPAMYDECRSNQA